MNEAHRSTREQRQDRYAPRRRPARPRRRAAPEPRFRERPDFEARLRALRDRDPDAFWRIHAAVGEAHARRGCCFREARALAGELLESLHAADLLELA